MSQVLEALSEKQCAPYRQGFNVALTAAANQVSKYLQLLPFATSARVLDPRQRAVLGSEVEMGSQIETYDCLFRKGECSDALQAEWDVYWKLPAIASTANFRILDWWEGMSEDPPPIVCRGTPCIGSPCHFMRRGVLLLVLEVGQG